MRIETADDETESRADDSGNIQSDDKTTEDAIQPRTTTTLEPDPRFEALVRDRDSLRVEVVEMRRTLEQIQSKHDEEMETLQKKLQDTQNEKHNAETQFRNLLGKVNTIKSQLGERLRADAVCSPAIPVSLFDYSR